MPRQALLQHMTCAPLSGFRELLCPLLALAVRHAARALAQAQLPGSACSTLSDMCLLLYGPVRGCWRRRRRSCRGQHVLKHCVYFFRYVSVFMWSFCVGVGAGTGVSMLLWRCAQHVSAYLSSLLYRCWCKRRGQHAPGALDAVLLAWRQQQRQQQGVDGHSSGLQAPGEGPHTTAVLLLLGQVYFRAPHHSSASAG